MSDERYVTQGACGEVSKRIFAKLDSIERRLFKDNGAISIQTRLDRHDQVLRVLLWMFGILGGSFLAALGSGLLLVMREWIARGA